jgi:hypothetical protein
MMTSERDRDAERLPVPAAERLLARAAELDALAESGGVSISHLRRASAEAGIGTEAFDAALAEVPEAPAAKVPLWVRVCMQGVPDRRAALAFYWFFLVGLCATPVAALTGFWARPVAVVWALFLSFALWSTSAAIRWLDRHGWDLLP